jgi:uncharacterized protein YjeT (DUF2065 family)
MSDFVVALGLFFAIEGLFLAAFPAGAKRTMASVLNTPDGPLRIARDRFRTRWHPHRLAGARLTPTPQSLFRPNPPPKSCPGAGAALRPGCERGTLTTSHSQRVECQEPRRP